MDLFAYTDTWRKSSFQICDIPWWVKGESWEGLGVGCLWGWGITLLPEPCTPPPRPHPTTQVAATERRWHGKPGTGFSRKTGERDYAQRVSVQRWACHLCRNATGRLSCQVDCGMWEMAPHGSASVLYTLCLEICLQHWRKYASESDLFRKGPKQLYHSIKICCKTHHYPSFSPTSSHEVLPVATHSIRSQWVLSHQACGSWHHQPWCAQGVFMVPTCLPSSTPWMFWGWIFIAFSFCLEEV